MTKQPQPTWEGPDLASVPLFTALKARQLGGFAALEAYPYAEVREWAETHLNDL